MEPRAKEHQPLSPQPSCRARRRTRTRGAPLWAVAMSVVATVAAVITKTIGVHGWVLPPFSPYQQQQHQHQHQHSAASYYAGVGGGNGGTNTICFQKGNFPNRNSNDCNRASYSHRTATPTDDEGEGQSEYEGEVFPASETERKKLIDALFKGSSSSSNANANANANAQQQEPSPPLPLSEKIGGFLDKPFFDPDAYDEQDDSFWGKIANFVRRDYELFEAIFVACFFLLLISITKDLLRAQMTASGAVAAASGKIF